MRFLVKFTLTTEHPRETLDDQYCVEFVNGAAVCSIKVCKAEARPLVSPSRRAPVVDAALGGRAGNPALLARHLEMAGDLVRR